MSEWSHLPNAQHIDRVIASLKKHKDIWSASWRASHDAVHDAAWSAIRSATRDAAEGADRLDVWYATQDAVYGTISTPELVLGRAAARARLRRQLQRRRLASGSAARAAILALVVYDDCEQYLNMHSKQLRVWATLTEHPAAVLLLPAVTAFERIKKLESV